MNVTASESSSLIAVAVAIAGSANGNAIGALLSYNYVGSTDDGADPNVISLADGTALADGTPSGIKTVAVTGADTATAASIRAYVDSSKVVAGGKVSIIAGFDDPTAIDSGSPSLGDTKGSPPRGWERRPTRSRWPIMVTKRATPSSTTRVAGPASSGS